MAQLERVTCLPVNCIIPDASELLGAKWPRSTVLALGNGTMIPTVPRRAKACLRGRWHIKRLCPKPCTNGRFAVILKTKEVS